MWKIIPLWLRNKIERKAIEWKYDDYKESYVMSVLVKNSILLIFSAIINIVGIWLVTDQNDVSSTVIIGIVIIILSSVIIIYNLKNLFYIFVIVKYLSKKNEV